MHKTSETNARNNFKEILEISWHRYKKSSLTTAGESAHFSSLSLQMFRCVREDSLLVNSKLVTQILTIGKWIGAFTLVKV